jgi:succinyl-diaminopimelate desuccinylase
MDFDAIASWIGAHADEMVDLQRGLTARPALGPDNGGQGEWAKAHYLEKYLAEHGLGDLQHFDCPDERVPEGTRPNLCLTVPGQSDEPCYWILSHLDVVPPGEKLPNGTWKGWDGDPYELRREGDRVIGRGVTDDQQAIVSSVFAVRALQENGATPAHTLKLLFVADEESGSHYGLGYILREHPELFTPRDCIIVPDHGTPDSTSLEVAEKGALWLEFRVQGSQAHASRPDDGNNAFRAAARLVCLLDSEMHRRFDEEDLLYEPPRSTFEPTLHEKNVPNVNTIPGEDIFCMDCRVLPEYNLDDVLNCARAAAREVDSRMDTVTTVHIRNRQDAPPPTPPDAPVVQLLQQAIQHVYGAEARPQGIGGQTVAAHFRQADLPAAVWMTALPVAHQANESCPLPFMVGDATVFARILTQSIPG